MFGTLRCQRLRGGVEDLLSAELVQLRVIKRRAERVVARFETNGTIADGNGGAPVFLVRLEGKKRGRLVVKPEPANRGSTSTIVDNLISILNRRNEDAWALSEVTDGSDAAEDSSFQDSRRVE